jgi:hypothetical protein
MEGLMKRFSILVLGIVLLLAGFSVPVFADSNHGSSAAQAGSQNKDSLTNQTVAFADYIKEIYTTLDPNQSAERYFFAGETIYFAGVIFLNIPSAYYVYTMVTNTGGNVVLLDAYGYQPDPSSSNQFFWFSTNTLASGAYNFSVLIATPNGLLLSPTAFGFVVQ